MADLKITQFTEDTSPTYDDLITTIHDPGGSPVNKKIILANASKALGWVDVRSYASINAAVTAIGATQTTLVVPNAKTLAANLTTPSTLSLVILNGGSIVKASTYTLTINGPFKGCDGCFVGFSAGDVTFGADAVEEVYPEWWGAKGDGVTDDSSFIQQCIIAAGSGPIAKLSNTTYKCNSGLSLSAVFTKLIGPNINLMSQECRLDFTSLASGWAITVTGGGCHLEGIAIYGGDNVTTDGGLYANPATYITAKNLYLSHFWKIGFKAIWNKSSICKYQDICIDAIDHGFGFYSTSSSGAMTLIELQRVSFINVEFACYLDSNNLKTTFRDCIWDSVVIALYAEMVSVQLENCHIEGASIGGVQISTLATTFDYGDPIDAPFYIFNGALLFKGTFFGYVEGTDPRYFHIDSKSCAYGNGALLELNDCKFSLGAERPNIVTTSGTLNRTCYINSVGLSESTVRRNFTYGFIADTPVNISGEYANTNSKAGLLMGGRYFAASTDIPTQGNWRRGDRTFNPYSVATQYGAEHVCLVSGSFDIVSVTGNTDGSTAIITNIVTTNLKIGHFVTISAGMPSASTPYMIIDKTANTVTLDTNSTSAQVGVTVATVAPIFAYANQPFYTNTYPWAIGSVGPGVTASSGDITVTGAELGDFVIPSVPADMAGVMATGYVKSTNTVIIVVYNPTGSVWTPGTFYWKVQVLKWRG